jgi:DNA-binding MarR family transcriptional regulator
VDTADSSPQADFGVLLAVAHGTFFDRLHRHMADVGFTGFSTRTGFVLRVLDGEALSLRELADRLEMSSPAALKVIDAMVRAGFAERVASPADRRVRAVRATVHGGAALDAAHRFHAAIEQEVVDAVGAEDAAAVRRGLEAIAGQASEVIPQVLRRSTAPH